MIKMSQIIKDMKAIDTSASLTTVMKDMEVEDDFLEIATIDHVDPSNALHNTKKSIDMQTVHTRIEPI